jgi:hypothetical protein
MSKMRISAKRRRIVAAAATAATATLLAARATLATTYNDATGTGDNWGPAYVDLASVNVTNDGSNITFQINVNSTADLTDPNQEFADYEIGFQTAPGGSTALVTPYNNQIGISTGMNYWIGSFASTPGASSYHWNGSSWDLTGGFGTSGPFLTVTRSATALTVTSPLSLLGLKPGNSFNFDVWTTFGQPGNQGAYDALDNPTRTGQPFSPVVAYDAATGSGSTFSTTVYTVVAPIWQTDGDGDWNAGPNWNVGNPPSGVDVEADLLGAISSTHTISSATAITLGTLRFNNANAYVLSGAGSLTMQTSSGSALVDVQLGNHQIALPLTIASNTTFNVATGSSLTLTGAVTVNAGEAVTQTGPGSVNYQSAIAVGTGGSITFGNSFHSTGLTLTSATATIAAHGAGSLQTVQFDTDTIDASSKIDVQDNAVILPDSLDIVRGYLFSGQIVSGVGAVGYGAVAGGTKAQYTLLGDSDLDGRVNVADLANLAGNFGKTSGQFWISGDFDYNGNVNVADLADLAGNFGKSIDLGGGGGGGATAAVEPAGAASSVPEPSSLSIIAIGATALSAGRRRRRQLLRVGAVRWGVPTATSPD